MAALAAAWLAAGPAAPARAAEPQDQGSLVDEPLESLLSMEVTSVSKRPQKVGETPAAIFVITQEDIRRSGHSNVAELLRMVPGVNMGRPTPKSWTIGIRGDQSQFSRMLLVLLDGRAVYNSSFNGTFWELTDVPLEDIDRIEVIRGPGASVWGANGVHGVINIIRKKPKDQHSFLTTAVGNEDRLVTSLGYTGGGDKLRYRVSGHYVNRDPYRSRDNSVEQHDGYAYGTTSLRADLDMDHGNELSVQGDWYGGDLHGQFRRDLDTTGNTVLRYFDSYAISGGNTLLHFEHKHSESASTELQLYIDHAYRNILIVKDRRTHYDLELRNRFQLGRQLFNWGLGTRHVHEEVGNTLNFIATPDRDDEAVYSGYGQDEIELHDGALRFILGTKGEWNTFTGWEFQPTARALWHPAEHHQVWAALSRSVRVPTRLDRGDYDVRIAYLANQPLRIIGTKNFDSEVIYETDLGYRFQPTPTLNLDLTAFDQRTQHFGVFAALPPFGLTQELHDTATRRSLGGEASVRWQPLPSWKLTLGYTHIHIHHTNGVFSPSGSESAPPHQLTLLSYLDLPGNLELDFGVYYHGPIGDRFSNLTKDHFNSYTRHDVRLGWRPTERLELSLVGQNLLDRLHREGADYFEGAPIITGLPQSSVQRSFFARVDWRF